MIHLDWAKHKIDWTMTDWNTTIWSDESKFKSACEENGMEYLPECIQQTVKFGSGSVMVWVCIWME